ncbi:MAG: PAS domain-containing sensor histidine kinase, partial [Lentimicrobium sp.]|nr:PAS domain-containing sensor histidine kinase [Lentimicrobium sp.]
TGVINFAQVLLDNYDFDPAGIDMVQKIIKEGDRIATITRNLISFARADVGLREPVNPVEIVNTSLSLVNNQLNKEGIRVVTDFSSENTLIVADSRKLQQVLLNLISNSRYALNARYPGFDERKIIDISCFEKSVNDHRVFLIVVKDYGTGLPQAILEHIFEPFFSTKPPGEGTGLGLSISYGIVKEHGGNMYVNSIMEKFTEMVIELPAGI